MERKALLLALVLAGLAVAGGYIFANAPTVEKVLTETPLTEGAGGGTAAIAVIEINESEEAETKPMGYWEAWEYYNKTRFQYYVDRTEIEWYEAPEKNRPVGRIVVDKEPLWNGIWDNKSNISVNPLDFFENKSRKGNCGITAQVSYELLRVKGEDVRVMSAENIDYNKEYAEKYPGFDHTWTEWTDSNGQKCVIDYNNIWSQEDWYTRYNWTVNLQQDKPK